MDSQIGTVVIAGGGSAGFLTALSFRVLVPQIEVVVVHSPEIPVIGVGESTTAAFSQFLHAQLGIDRGEFLREVQPSWKLGLRLEWGDPRDTHFNYPFDRFLDHDVANLPRVKAFYCLQDMEDCSHFAAMMDRGLAPCAVRDGHGVVDPRATYHIKNEAFIAYLEKKSRQLGVRVIEGEIKETTRDESGNLRDLVLKDGREVSGDFFIDCTGFRSLLLEQTMGVRRVSFGDALFCDAAVIGSWQRPEEDEDIRPYTTVETMDHGWCWRIDFLDVVTRGYVFSTAFCTPEEAMKEMKAKNPQLGDDLRSIHFPSFRCEHYWKGNVAAVGNASGFVEPLEATALHLIIQQIWNLTGALRDGDYRPSSALRALENRRFQECWDDTRDFLALHYRYNGRSDTPFWRHCREHTPLGGAEELVRVYSETGPAASLKTLFPATSIFGYDGFVTMLLGQRVPTKARTRLTAEESGHWNAHRDRIRNSIKAALPMKPALLRIFEESKHWPKEGI